MKNFINKLKLKLIKLVEYIHLKFFGHEMSDTMRKFLQNLGISMLGGFIASSIAFGSSILVGRMLGPVEYGRYTLFMTAIATFAIFLSMGLETAIIKYNRNKKENIVKQVFSTIIIFFIGNATIWFLVFIIFRTYLGNLFSISTQLVVVAIILAIVNIFSVILENALKSMFRFKHINVVRTIQNILLVVILSIFFIIGHNLTVAIYGILFIIVLVITNVVFIFSLKKYIKIYFSKGIFQKVLKFSFVSFAGVLAGYLIQNGDNLIINYFLGKRVLGIYNAYYTLAMMVSGQIVAFFIAVYFPMIVSLKNKEVLFKKIKKTIWIITIPWIAFNVGVIFIGLKLFGDQYVFNILFALFFSIYTLLFLVGQLYGHIVISSEDDGLVKKMYFTWLGVVVVHFIAVILVAQIVTLSVGIILGFYVGTYFLNAILNIYYAKKV